MPRGEGNGAGRPTILENPDRVSALLNAIRLGLHIEQACLIAGVSKSSYYNYLKQAEDPECPEDVRQFLDALKKADAECEATVLNDIREEKHWTAKAWFLERRFRDRWGRHDTLKVEHSNLEELHEQLDRAARGESQQTKPAE